MSEQLEFSWSVWQPSAFHLDGLGMTLACASSRDDSEETDSSRSLLMSLSMSSTGYIIGATLRLFYCIVILRFYELFISFLSSFLL